MKSILTATLAAGVFVGLTLPIEAQAADGGRWCTTLSSTNPKRSQAAQSVSCDGFDKSGTLYNLAEIQSVSVQIFNKAGKPERVTVENPFLYARNIADLNNGKPDDVRQAVDEYLVKQGKPMLAGRLINVDAIRIASDEKVYANYENDEVVAPQKLEIPEGLRKLDPKKPLAAEMQCLAKMGQTPAMSNGGVLSGGDAEHQPVIVLQAEKFDGYRTDFVFTPDGFYANKYSGAFSNRNGEHYVEIPGAAGTKSQYYHHSWSPSGWQTPIIQSEPLKNSRVPLQKLDASSLITQADHPAMKALHRRMLLATRDFRDEFDGGSPRFRTPNVMAQVRSVVEACKGIKGLQPEIGFFENYIFRAQPGVMGDAHRPNTLPPLKVGVGGAQKGGAFQNGKN